ncbi:MAG: hypothetical protein ACRYHQ_15780 [Janthinobacterium lividum]
MSAPLRRLFLACLVLPLLPSLARAAGPAPAPANPAAAPNPATATAKPGPAWPSFLVSNEVLCLDELDFNAFARTGRFHTRGSQESCTRVTALTRVVVKAQSGPKSEVLVVAGPLAWNVGWTNGRLPLAGTTR